MHADLAIERQRARADQRRQLTGGAPAREVHLEEAVLGVDETDGTRHIGARAAAYGRDAEGIARDRDRLRESCDLAFAVELRQAATQLGSRPRRRHRHRDGQQDEQGQKRAKETAHHACQY